MLYGFPVSPFHRGSHSITTTISFASLQQYATCTSHQLSPYVIPTLPVLVHIFRGALLHFVHKIAVFITLFPSICSVCQCRTDYSFRPEWQQAFTPLIFLLIFQFYHDTNFHFLLRLVKMQTIKNFKHCIKCSFTHIFIADSGFMTFLRVVSIQPAVPPTSTDSSKGRTSHPILCG